MALVPGWILLLDSRLPGMTVGQPHFTHTIRFGDALGYPHECLLAYSASLCKENYTTFEPALPNGVREPFMCPPAVGVLNDLSVVVPNEVSDYASRSGKSAEKLAKLGS
jgi:hypothetical protein